jgi:hypothetical protein
MPDRIERFYGGLLTGSGELPGPALPLFILDRKTKLMDELIFFI